MELRNLSYGELANRIREEQKEIIVYGAGMIGQIVIPDRIDFFRLREYLRFYVDADPFKQGQKISVGGYGYEIKSPETLQAYCGGRKNIALIITNSHFYPIVKALDELKELEEVEAYIAPVMQVTELKNAVKASPVMLEKEPVIPKVIHYCWFSGKEIPDEFKRNIEGWERCCPGYEIRRWDESNYDVGKNPYMAAAYEHKKWGFIPDYARLDILYHQGGIYMDTDVELVRNLDELLYQPAFCGVEKWGNINMGGCSGAVAHHPMLWEMLQEREKISFIKEDGSLNLETCGIYETRPFIRAGMRIDNQVQNIGGMTVYSSDYFHPYDYMSGELTVTENTFSIHHFNGGWLDQKAKEQREKTRKLYQAVLQRMERGNT